MNEKEWNYVSPVNESPSELEVEAIAKRPAFLKDLENAKSLEDIKQAYWDYAVNDEVVNFREGTIARKSDWTVGLDKVVSELDRLVDAPPRDSEDYDRTLFNGDAGKAIARVLESTEGNKFATKKSM